MCVVPGEITSWVQMPAWGAGHRCLRSVTSARAQWCTCVWLCAVQQPPHQASCEGLMTADPPRFVCLNLLFTPREEAKHEELKVWIFLLKSAALCLCIIPLMHNESV